MENSIDTNLFGNVTAILGFGFIGLAFIMAFLGYSALKQVIGAPNPRSDVIKLAKSYFYISLALLVSAGPLHFALLWAQQKFSQPTPVNVTISLASTTWQPQQYGEVGIMRGGKFIPFSSEAVKAQFADGDEVNVQLDKVIRIIDTMRAQIVSTSQATQPTPAGTGSGTPADAAIRGG